MFKKIIVILAISLTLITKSAVNSESLVVVPSGSISFGFPDEQAPRDFDALTQRIQGFPGQNPRFEHLGPIGEEGEYWTVEYNFPGRNPISDHQIIVREVFLSFVNAGLMNEAEAIYNRLCCIGVSAY